MILRRLGNKSKTAREIIKYFPEHKIYIEPFFGAGGIFFNKPKAQYNILNDIDSDVFNLFQVILNRGDEFLELLELAPYSSELFEYWKKNKESDPVKKAVRFVCLSNYGYLGKNDCIRLSITNEKQITILAYKRTLNFLKDCSLKFANFDFRKFLKTVSFRSLSEKKGTFIYCDPPYLGTSNNYSNGFLKQDFIDLLDCLTEMDCKFAVSEFNNEFVLSRAEERGLNVITIGERRTLKNRNNEILITNYITREKLFD